MSHTAGQQRRQAQRGARQTAREQRRTARRTPLVGIQTQGPQSTPFVGEQSRPFQGPQLPPEQPTTPAPRPQAPIPTIIDTDKIRDRVTDATTRIQEVEDRELPKEPTQEEDIFAQLEGVQEEEETRFDDLQRQLKRLERGGVPLTQDEQAGLNFLTQSFADLAQEQRQLNLQAAGATARGEARAGRARFAPELAQQAMQEIAQEGLDNLVRLNIQASKAFSDARTAIRDKKFNEILATDDALSSALKTRKDTILDLQSSIISQQKEARAQEESDLKQQKLLADINRIQSSGAAGTGGVSLSALDRLKARNLSTQIFGKRAGADPANIGLIQDLMADGLSIDNIQDSLNFAGQSAAFQGSIRDAGESIALGLTDKKGQIFLDTLDRSLEEGNPIRIRQLVQNQAFNTLGTEEAKKARGDARALDLLNEIEADLQAYEDGGGNTNVFKGNANRVKEKIGVLGNADEQRIASKIQVAIQKYRQAISGAAFTESESKEYKRVFPSTSNTRDLNSAKIGALKDVLDGNTEFVVSAVIGSGAYNDIFNESPGTIEAPPTDTTSIFDITTGQFNIGTESLSTEQFFGQ